MGVDMSRGGWGQGDTWGLGVVVAKGMQGLGMVGV